MYKVYAQSLSHVLFFCNSIDCSPTGSDIYVDSKVYVVCAKLLQSCPTHCDSMDIPFQAPLSMGFSRQEYRSGLPFLPPRDLPDLGIKPTSSVLVGTSFPLSHLGSPGM